jgi:hypothetical protein
MTHTAKVAVCYPIHTQKLLCSQIHTQKLLSVLRSTQNTQHKASTMYNF